MVDVNLTPEQIQDQMSAKKWEKVQIKGLCLWMNSVLPEDKHVQNVPDDVRTGERFLELLQELRTDGTPEVPKYNIKPKNRYQELENNSLLINHMSKALHIRLVGIGAEDIVDGRLKLVVGMMWSLFRSLGLGSLTAGDKSSKKSPEEELLAWWKEMTESFGVEIKDFKTSFQDGKAWACLVHQFNPDTFSWDEANAMPTEQRLDAVFENAESKLGVPRLFEAKDLITDEPVDERSIILYSTLFYHAWTKSGKTRLANEQARSLKMNAKQCQEELDRIRQLIEDLRPEHDAMLEKRAQLRREALEASETLEELRAKFKLIDGRSKEVTGKVDGILQSRKEVRAGSLESVRAVRDKEEAALAAARAAVSEKGIRNGVELSRRQGIEDAVAGGLLATEGFRNGMLNGLGGRLAAGGNLDHLTALLRDHVNALYRNLETIEASDEQSKGGAVAEIGAAIKALVRKTEGMNGDELADEMQKQLVDAHATTLPHALRIRDARFEVEDAVAKKGHLMAYEEGKRWKKRWFVLRGFTLYYYDSKEDQDQQPAGEISLLESVVSPKDAKEGRLKWNMKIVTAVEGPDGDKRKEVLQVAAKTKEDRNDWFFHVQGRILYVQYLEDLKAENQERPDLRLINLLSRRNMGAVDMDNAPVGLVELRLLEKMLTSHSEVMRFSFCNAGLTDDHAVLLGSIFDHRDELLGLNLARNDITSFGMKALCETLVTHETLVDLSLSHNEFDDEALGGIAAVIASNPSLATLGLCHNHLVGNTPAFAAFVNAVSELEDLRVLDLEGNELNDDGAVALAALLEKQTMIGTLKLGSNMITDVGAVRLCQALEKNTTIHTVDLSGNSMGAVAMLAIRSLFDANTHITSIDMSRQTCAVGDTELSVLSDWQGVSIHNLVFRRL